MKINSKDFFFNQKNFQQIGSWCPMKYHLQNPSEPRSAWNDSHFSIGQVKNSVRRPMTAWTGGGFKETEKTFKSSMMSNLIKGSLVQVSPTELKVLSGHPRPQSSYMSKEVKMCWAIDSIAEDFPVLKPKQKFDDTPMSQIKMIAWSDQEMYS